MSKARNQYDIQMYRSYFNNCELQQQKGKANEDKDKLNEQKDLESGIINLNDLFNS